MDANIRILVVDDEPDIRQLLRILLENRSYQVAEASSGEEAVRRLRTDPAYDLVVMDIMMPGMDGVEACRSIRSFSTAPILFLPAKTQLGDPPERQIVAELIREKSLHCLNEEIPHGIAVAIDQMKMNKKVCHIDATIICERDSHKGIIIGKQGSMLKKIGSTARYEIERLLDCKVNLKLWVKVQKNWRDSDYMMKNFGYREDDMS